MKYPPACLVDIPDRNMRARVAGMQLPPFHALGIVVQLYAPLFTCVSMVFFPPVVGRTNTLPVIPTPENVLHHSMRTGCNVMVTVPTFMSVWASEPTAVAALRDMELVVRLLFMAVPYLTLILYVLLLDLQWRRPKRETW